MIELEDTRDQTFTWTTLQGYPLDVRITRDSKEVGRLKTTNALGTEYEAHFAGVDWLIQEVHYGGHRALHISFAKGPIVGVTEKHIFAPLKITLDGTRVYLLERDSYHVSSWQDKEGADALIFHSWDLRNDAPKTGDILVTRQANDLDSPPLAVIGLLLAVRGQLFGRDLHP